MGGDTPLFADVWQAKDFKSNDFGSVANTGVAFGISGCVANAGVSCEKGAATKRDLEFKMRGSRGKSSAEARNALRDPVEIESE
jgi:hypothetical protein